MKQHCSDTVQRFLFEQYDIRGEFVCLDESYQDIISKHQYPQPVQHLLAECLATVVLLTETLKFKGTISLQLKAKHLVPMLVAECTHDRKIRATAQYDVSDVENCQLNGQGDVLLDGQLAITITPVDGQRYQSIVALESSSVKQAIEQYFETSEQLATRVWLSVGNGRAAGMLLQRLPQQKCEDQDAWQRLCLLSNTITAQELLTVEVPVLLKRLFVEEDVMLFDSEKIQFSCSCSRKRTEDMLKSLGHGEVQSILDEQGGEISVDCQFCHEIYRFSGDEIMSLFLPKDSDQSEQKPTLH